MKSSLLYIKVLLTFLALTYHVSHALLKLHKTHFLFQHVTCSHASAPSHVLFSLYLNALSEATIRPPDPTSKTTSLLKPSPASLEGVTLSLCPHSPFPHLCVYSCYETFPGHLCKLLIPPPNTSAPSSMFICFSQALAIISCFIYFTASSCSLSV